MNDAAEKSVRSPSLAVWLRVGLVLNAVAIAVAAWYVLAPLATRVTNAPATTESLVPDMDFDLWRDLAVQDGRTRPFGTYCDEAICQITGRERFAGYESTGIVLTWMLGDRGQPEPGLWETQPFILCDHRDLRAAIYAHVEAAGEELTTQQRQGKYISPADLRASGGFDELLARVARARKEFGAKAHFRLSPAEIKAEEVAERLVLYDVLCGRAVTRLYKNAMAKGQYFDLADFAVAGRESTSAVFAGLEAKLRPTFDPLHVVALDRTPQSEWLSLGQLEALTRDPKFWPELLEARAAENPAEYEAPSSRQPPPTFRTREVRAAFARVQAAFRADDADSFALESVRYFDKLQRVSDETHAGTGWDYPGVTTIPLELQLAKMKPFRMAWLWMLVALGLLILAEFFEQTLSAPASVPAQSKPNKLPKLIYVFGLMVFCVSLFWQTTGFTYRILISGFAPVSNMYESVIFAAYVAAILGLVLEAIYRRRVIAIAAAGVATFGLVLADQLPLALDPSISPLVPVLRTNYWLTIHVLTIVASYAAATLAWGLGNLSLGLMAFSRPRPDMLKVLSLFIYRALQVAVLLLATGTLLGGWWAAESWGRFWGWDPKEVGALIALVCYVIPLHARYIGWVRDYGLAVSAVVCYAAIILSWYVVNFVLAAGLHSYGFSSGGSGWVVLGCLVNLEWLLVTAEVRRVKGEG